MQDPFDFDLESRPYSDLFSPEDFSVDPFNLPETPKEQKDAPAPATAKPTAPEAPAFDFSQDPFADSGFDFSQEPATGKESAKKTPAKPKEDRSLLGEFGAGLARGIDTTQAMGYGLASLSRDIGYGLTALAGDLIGADSLENWALKKFSEDNWASQGFARNMQEAQKNAASVRFLDISEGENFLEDTSNFIRWAAGGLGELAPTIAVTFASGGAGGVAAGATRAALPKLGEAAAKKYISRAAIKKFGKDGLAKKSAKELTDFADQAIKNLGTSAGVLASSVGMNTGEIYGNFIDPETGEINEDSTSRAGRVLGTIGGGMLAGALDSLIPAKLFGKANLSKDDVIRNALRKIPTSQRAAKAAGEILLNTTVEGTTEAAQELISEAVGVSVDSIKDWDWDSLRPELIEAFALGALGGSVMTAPVEATQAVREIALAPQIENRLFSIANDRLTASKGTEFTEAAPDVKAAMLKKEQEFVRENYVELRDKEIADRDATITDLADARLTRQMGEEYTTADEEAKKGLLEDEKDFIVNNTGVVQEEEIAAQNEEVAEELGEMQAAFDAAVADIAAMPEMDALEQFQAARQAPAAPAAPAVTPKESDIAGASTEAQLQSAATSAPAGGVTVAPLTVDEASTTQGRVEANTANQAAQGGAEVVSDYIGSQVTYGGRIGELRLDGQTLVVETPTEIIEIGNAGELNGRTLGSLGMSVQRSVVTPTERGTYLVRGKEYRNLYSDPRQAITTDAQGNKTVRLNTADAASSPRTFRGAVAEEIAYQIELQFPSEARYTTRPETSPLAAGLPDITRAHQLVNNSIKAGRLLGVDVKVRNPDTTNPDPAFRNVGGTYTPSQRTINLALSETVGVSDAMATLHEVLHDIYRNAPKSTQQALVRWMRDIPEGELLPFTDPRHTDPRLRPDNPNNLPEGVFQEEMLVESLTQYGVQQDIAEGIIADLIRILKDLYYRAAMAIGEALNRPIEVTARAWAENKVQAVIAGQSPSFNLIDTLRGRQYSRLAYNTQVYNTDGTFNLKLQNGVLVLPRVIGDDAGSFLANMAVHEENANQALLKTQLATQRTGEAAAQYEQNQRIIRMAELDVEYFEALDQGDQEAAARVVAEAQSLTEDAAGQPDPETVVRGEGGRILAPSERFNVEVFFNTQRGVDQTRTPEFKAWFGDSKVVDENGDPLVVYHGTVQNFEDIFDPEIGDLGSHFGSPAQANEFSEEGGRIYPVFLSIKNPLRLIDTGGFSPSTVLAQLIDQGVVGDEYLDSFDDIEQGEVVELIKGAGYDGVVYLNRREGTGTDGVIGEDEMTDAEFQAEAPSASDSYIVFEPTQIKSATGNRGTFDPNDPNILRTTRGTPFTLDYEGNSRDQLIKAKQQVIRLKAAEARVGIAAQNQIAEYLAPVFDKFPDLPREKLLNIIGRNDPISEMQTLIQAYAEQREIILGDLSDSELETVLSEEGAEPTSEITYDDLETEGQRTMFKDSIKGAAINYPEKLAKIKATLVKDAEEGQRSLDRNEERYNTTLAHLGDVKVLEAEARKAITAEFNQLKKDVEKNSRADGADGLIAGLFSALYQSGPEIFPKRFQQLLSGLELDDNTSLFLLNRELMALDLNWDAKLKDIYPEAIQKIREAIAENPDTPLSLLMSGPQFSRGDEVIRSLAENDLLEKLRGSARLATMLSFAKKHRLAAEALAAAQADAQTKQQMMEDLADLRVRNTQDQIEELKALVRNRSPLTQSARDRLVISLADQKKKILSARESVRKMEEQGPILDAARGAAMRHYDRVTKDLGISAYWQLLDGAPVPTEINMDARPEDVLNGTNDGSKIVKLDLRQNSLAANSRLDLSLDVHNKAVEIKKYLALHKNDEAFADTYAYRELTRMADAMAENSLRSDFTVVAKGGMRDGMRSVAGIAAKTGTVGGRTVEQMSKGYDRLIQSYNKFEVDGAAVSGLRARALKASKMRSSDHFSDMYSTAMAILDNEVVLTGKRALDAMVETLKGNPSYREALSYPDAEKLFTEYVTRNMEMGGRAMEIRAENGLLVREKIGDREIFRDHLNRGWGATAARVVKDFPYTLINNAIILNPGLMLVDGPLFLKTEVDEEGNVVAAETMEEFGARLKQVFDGTHNLKENVIDQILLNVAKDRFPHPQNKDVKLSNYEMRLAYDSANGDVAGMIQYLADSYGVPVAEYANEFMGAIESLMSKAISVGASKETPVGNVKIAPDLQSKYGSDARVGDDFPPLWVKYMEYGELQNSYIVRQIAAEAMFGRDFSKLETAVNQMKEELKAKADAYKLALDKARNADTLKVDLKSVKKDLGKDYEDFKAAYELIEKGGFKPNSVLNAITSIIQSPETTFKLGALEELHSFIITGMLQGWETSLKQLSQIYMTTAAFRAVSRFNVLDPFINLFRTVGAFANWPLNFFGMEPFRVPFADRIIAENLHELQDSVRVGNTFKEIGISGHFSREDGARFSQMARGARAVVSRWSLRPKGEFLFPGFTLFPFRAFNQISMIVGTSDIMTKMEKLIKRSNQYLIENPDKQTIDLRTITAGDLGYKNRLLGLDDATFWDNFMDAMYSYGVTLDQIVATYNAEKSQGLSGMDAKMVRTAHSMSKNFFSSESGLSTRPTIAQKSGLGRASFSLLGWSIQTGMYFIDGLMGRKITGEKRKKFADRLTSSIAAQKAYMFHLMPLAVLASLLFDEWDEEIEGKKSDRRPLLGAPNPTEFGLSVLERVGAMGPFGIVGDLGNSIANIGTGKPALSFDERVVWAGVLQDWQQLVSTAISTEAYKNPSNLTYNQFLRPAMQSLGLGSVLSNGQVINNLLGLNNAESRTATRINTNNALRGAGRVTGLEVRSFGAGGYARSVPYTPHVTNMILSAMSNDGRQFRESYNLAVEQMMKFKDVPRGEAEDRVGRSYAQRHPLKAVFKTTPTSGEYKAMLESMSPDLRQSVEVSLNNFNRWGETIGVKPYRGKGSSKKEGKKKLASGTEALSFEEQLNQQLTSRYSL